jgi:predicted ABC-type ATPase
VVLCFIGIPSHGVSDQRVAIRVSQGGHDVPADRIRDRFPRTLANLKRAISELPLALVFDDGDLARPYRRPAEFEIGDRTFLARRLPRWRSALLET